MNEKRYIQNIVGNQSLLHWHSSSTSGFKSALQSLSTPVSHKTFLIRLLFTHGLQSDGTLHSEKFKNKQSKSNLIHIAVQDNRNMSEYNEKI